MKRSRVSAEFIQRPGKSRGGLWTPSGPQRPQGKYLSLPPFSIYSGTVDPTRLIEYILSNPHPTDLVLDTSFFAPERLSLVRQILVSLSPIVLPAVVGELEDLKAKARLAELREIVFPMGQLNPRFRGDERGALSKYGRLATRYGSLLEWRREAIAVASRRIERETGVAPSGRERSKLIRELIANGVAGETIAVANKFKAGRNADEVLAVFATLSPIVTGRDCIVLTADQDIVEQVDRLWGMLFDDYGAYLIAKDFRENGSRYDHRHPWNSMMFDGAAEAVGRDANPTYLLPPLRMIPTCATTIIDVPKMESVTWVSARSMEPALAFQNADPLCRKGDPGNGLSILFSAPKEPTTGATCRDARFHFVLGTPKYLKTGGDELGPFAFFDLGRVMLAARDAHESRRSRLVTPYENDLGRLLRRWNKVWS